MRTWKVLLRICLMGPPTYLLFSSIYGHLNSNEHWIEPVCYESVSRIIWLFWSTIKPKWRNVLLFFFLFREFHLKNIQENINMFVLCFHTQMFYIFFGLSFIYYFFLTKHFHFYFVILFTPSYSFLSQHTGSMNTLLEKNRMKSEIK